MGVYQGEKSEMVFWMGIIGINGHLLLRLRGLLVIIYGLLLELVLLFGNATNSVSLFRAIYDAAMTH